MSYYQDSTVFSQEYNLGGISNAGFTGSMAQVGFVNTGASAASSSSAASQIAKDLLNFATAGSSSNGAFFGASGSLNGSSANFGSSSTNFGASSVNIGGSSANFGGSFAGSSGVMSVGAASGGNSIYMSQVEAAILSSMNQPININETEEITVLGNKGIWANKAEMISWKGAIPIKQYSINVLANSEVITKKNTQKLYQSWLLDI